MRTRKLVYKIENILQGKEMTCKEIMAELERGIPTKRGNSFTYNQIGQLLRNKRFEKIGWCKVTSTNIWRNKNVMDRKIQTE